MSKGMTLPQLNAWLTDKHGGKAAIQQRQWDEFKSARAEIKKKGDDPNYAKNANDEVMKGVYGSFENLKGSVDNFYLAVGKANEGLLKFSMDGLGNAIDQFSKMPKGAQQATSLAAGGIATDVSGAEQATSALDGVQNKAAELSSASAAVQVSAPGAAAVISQLQQIIALKAQANSGPVGAGSAGGALRGRSSSPSFGDGHTDSGH